jgi:hypothetical protein
MRVCNCRQAGSAGEEVLLVLYRPADAIRLMPLIVEVGGPDLWRVIKPSLTTYLSSHGGNKTMRFINDRVHGVLDYLVALTLVVAPFIAGFTPWLHK